MTSQVHSLTTSPISPSETGETSMSGTYESTQYSSPVTESSFATLTSSSFTTPCTKTDGMDSRMSIPDDDITTSDDDTSGSLR